MPIFTHGTYALIAVIVLTYLFFPSAYIQVSQTLFTKIYEYLEPPILSPAEHLPIASTTKRLQVIARPPQTPYDSMLAVLPVRTGIQGDDLVTRYVYNREGAPIGYIDEKRGDLYVIILFSSTLSEEIFSLDGYVVTGSGSGSGGFSITVPEHVTHLRGTPIIHQPTGIVVGSVVAAEDSLKQGFVHVHSTISSNPLQTPILYMPVQGGERISEKEQMEVITNLRNVLPGEQDAAVREDDTT